MIYSFLFHILEFSLYDMMKKQVMYDIDIFLYICKLEEYFLLIFKCNRIIVINNICKEV